MPSRFYDEVFHSLYKNDVLRVKNTLKQRGFAVIYVDRKDHPERFLSFLANAIKASVSRRLTEGNAKDELPSELKSEATSSVQFLTRPGLEVWWVSSNSSPRVQEVIIKLLKARWTKSIVVVTSEKRWFRKIGKIERDILLKLPPVKEARLARYAEHYADSIGCKEILCFKSLEHVPIEVHMLDVERLVQYVKEAISICSIDKPCQRLKCLGISQELAETLLAHFSQDLPSISTSLRYRILDYVYWLYEKKGVNFKSKMKLQELLEFRTSSAYNPHPIDSLAMILELRDLKSICLDVDKRYVILFPTSHDVVRRLNIKCFTEIYESSNQRTRQIKILSALGASLDGFRRLQTVIDRRLNDDIALNFGLLLWLRKELYNLFPESCPSQSELRKLLIANLDVSSGQYSWQWNRALDFIQSLERISFSRDLEIAIFSRYLHTARLEASRKAAEYIFRRLIVGSMKRLQSILENSTQTEAITVDLRDLLCTEICDAILLSTDMRIAVDPSVLEQLIHVLRNVIVLTDYGTPGYDWTKIGSKILSAAVSVGVHAINMASFISESLRFERDYDENIRKTENLRQSFYELQRYSKEEGSSYLNIFLKVIGMIRDLWLTISNVGDIARELPDAAKLTNNFENLYYDIVSWAVEKKRRGILNSFLISDMIYHAFGLFKSDFIPSELRQLLSDEFDDVVLLVVDAMPLHFRDLFQAYRRMNLRTLVGFSVIPSETGPGHVSIFTGLPPTQTHIFSNTLVLENRSVFLLDSRKPKALPRQLEEICRETLSNRLRNTGIKTTIFIPSKYQNSLLTKIILGGSLTDSDVYSCKGGVEVFKEAMMIPIGNTSKKFYIILDNEIDATQHAELKRYYYREKEIERLVHFYNEYFGRLTAFLHNIIRNANRKGRRLLAIITADHGVTTLRYVDSSFAGLLNECGLEFVGSRGRIVNCPYSTKLSRGIYSKYDLTLFEKPQICKRIGLTRQQAQATRLGFANIHTIYGMSRAVLVYVSDQEKFDSLRLVSLRCDNCGYSDSVVITNYGFCPKCGASDPESISLGHLKTELVRKAKKFNLHIVFTKQHTSSDDSDGIMDPHFMVFPKFDSIISRYPRNPRETIMYLLQSERKPASRAHLVSEYLRLNGVSRFDAKTKEEFDQALQDLINLDHIEVKVDGSMKQKTEEYTGICTVITHGGFSPLETMVPLVLVTN